MVVAIINVAAAIKYANHMHKKQDNPESIILLDKGEATWVDGR